jgi:hypothetical protein
MSTVANGRQLISNSMNDVDNAMQGLGAGQPPADATALIGTASSALKQGIAYINEGSTDVFRPERVFLIMVIGIIIVLDLACAYWSGKSAKASGRRYWPAFGLGVLLGPVGLAITIFLNRRQTVALEAPEPVPGYLLPDFRPLVGGDNLSSSGATVPTPSGPKKKPAVKTTAIKCPHCGADVTSPPFCKSCGKMLGL